MLDALAVKDHAIGGVLLQHRVVGADLLDEAAVARAGRLGDDDPVERALLGAAAGETNAERHGLILSGSRSLVGFSKSGIRSNRPFSGGRRGSLALAGKARGQAGEQDGARSSGAEARQ